MNKRILMLASFLSFFARAEAPLAQLNIDTDQISISGLSSGGYMATQYHLAHAEQVSGVGIIAGGPFYCAQGNLGQAMAACLNKEDNPINLEAIKRSIKDYQDRGLLASDEEIAQAKVWIFHGANDETVGRHVANKLVEQYTSWFSRESLDVVLDDNASHHFPTLSNGHDCDVSEPPFIGACDYDGAGAMLNSIQGPLQQPSDSPKGNVHTIKQRKLGGKTAKSIARKGFLYVPDACLDGEPCQLHVSFHGCKQNHKTIGTQYIDDTGINRWADTNRMVVLYPQTKNSVALPFNPYGCWDWWGYTDDKYATRDGKQIKAIHTIIATLGKQTTGK